MSGRTLSQDGLMAHRSEVIGDGEPLFTVSCSVQELGPSSLGHTTPREARGLLGLTAEDDVRVEIYEDGYFVTVEGDDDGDE